MHKHFHVINQLSVLNYLPFFYTLFPLFSTSMASCENNDTSLVDIDLEAFEIDENLLRELLEEEEGKSDVHDNKECIEESINVNPNMMDEEQEGQKHNCLEKSEGHYVHDFEWLNMMDMMEPANPLDDMVTMNWFSDDVGRLDFDFGYVNGEFCPQICDGHFSNDANYGCLWGEY